MPSANRLILSDAVGSSDVAMVGVTPRRACEHARDRLGVFLVHGDDQPGGLRIARAQVHQLRVGLRQHGRQPLALDGEGGAQALAGEVARQSVVERGLVFDAVRRRPLHAPVDAREIHRAHHAPILQGVAVAVFEVGLREIAVVADERDRPLVRAERRPRQAEAPPRRVERLPSRVAPRAAVAGVVDLVEDRQRASDQRPQRRGRRRHLLVRHHDAVHVRRQPAVADVPFGIEVDVQALRRVRPLELEVLRGDDHHDAANRARQQRASGGGQRERRLARARRRDRQEVGRRARLEARERITLPRAQPGGPAPHGVRRRRLCAGR